MATSSNLTEGIEMKTTLPPLTKISELFFIFNYIDVYLDGTEKIESFKISMGQIVPALVEEGKPTDHTFYLSSERFYELVASQVPDFNATVLKKRKPIQVDFELVIGDEDYYYYRQNTLPSDDLNQLKPQYSNITNGYGVFASKWKQRVTEWAIGTQPNIIDLKAMQGLKLSKFSQIALRNGFIENKDGIIELGTASKKFCIDPDVAPSYRCDTGDDCLCD
jgi:hypothetical protein